MPVTLENRILAGEVPNEDLIFRRYKTLLIPIDGLISKTSGLSLVELTTYFLRNSNIKQVDNTEDPSMSPKLPNFPFKCIGLVQTVALPPFNHCSLSPV